MSNIRSFKELRVWQNAMDVAMKIFEVTKSFPVEERFSLTDQIRRSSRSVAANITEGWNRRDKRTRGHGDTESKPDKSPRHRVSPSPRLFIPAAFVSKLSDAESEAAETQTWIEIALRCGYWTQEEALYLDSRCEEILGQIVAMINSPEKWTIRSNKSNSPISKS